MDTDRPDHLHKSGHMLFNEAMRNAARREANAWTADQAARLDTTPEVILAAIRERA